MEDKQHFVKKVLEIAVNAPSGHNCQPWKFIFKGDVLYLWNDPNKDLTIFNYQQRGSLISHGTVIENIVIISSYMGYETIVDLFPEKKTNALVAKIKFVKKGGSYAYEYLFSQIEKRTTNRKFYEPVPIRASDAKGLSKHVGASISFGAQVHLLVERKDIEQAADIFSVGDRVLFDNFFLHKALFSIVNWTTEEEMEKRTGLFVGTKELPTPARWLFKYFIKSWTLMRIFSFIDLPSKMGKRRRALYSHSSAIGLVTAKSDSPEEFVNAGRALQRFWLETSNIHMSFQPISVGLLYLGQRTLGEIPEELTHAQYRYVKNAYEMLLSLFKIGSRVPTFSFRIGYSDPPTARSLKQHPNLIFM